MNLEEKKKIIALGKKLARECQHPIVLGEKDSSAQCEVCGKWLGWWCPDSPNHVCEYYGKHPSWYNPYGEEEFYNEDDCIYCHEPEERK